MGRDEGWWWAVYIDMIDITPTKQAVYIYIYINLLQVPSLLLFNFGFCIELYNWTSSCMVIIILSSAAFASHKMKYLNYGNAVGERI